MTIGDEYVDRLLEGVVPEVDDSVFARRKFDGDERHVSDALETAARLFEVFADDLNPCREKQLSLEKAQEALIWARRAIVVAGVRRDVPCH